MSTVSALVVDAERRAGDRALFHTPTATGYVPVRASDVAQRRRALAAALIARGINVGDRVAIVSDTRLEWLLADWAILTIGAVSVGIYPSSTAKQMASMLAIGRCRAVFVAGDGPRQVLAEALKHTPAVSLVVDLDDKQTAPTQVTLQALIAEGSARPDLQTQVDARCAQVNATDDAALVFTSGTTGESKGVVLSHHNIFSASQVGISALGVNETDVGVGFLPLAHALARVNSAGILHAGNQTWFARSLETVADVWQHAQPTVLALVPRVLEKVRQRVLDNVAQASPLRRRLFARALAVGTEVVRLRQQRKPVPTALLAEHALWDRLVARRVRNGIGWSRLRFALCGGAALRLEVAEFFAALGVTILEGYGLSETSAATVLNVPKDNVLGCIGKPLRSVEAKLDDDGELLLKCPGLFVRYEGDPEATRAALTPDGFFRTGDVATIDGAGRVRITDRKKDLIVTAGGKNVAPQHVEGALCADARITHAMVFGEGQPYLVALLHVDRTVSDRRGAAAQAVAAANATLSRVEQIKRFHVIDDEPTVENGLLTPTQKVRRKAAAERHAASIAQLYQAPSEV